MNGIQELQLSGHRFRELPCILLETSSFQQKGLNSFKEQNINIGNSLKTARKKPLIKLIADY